ncbi:MAG: hypothetical protein U9Q06_01145 [Nanoarchaeota archaeon]|nr:hypothetical protein [Nanoarchaeota archaeon]
MNNEKLIELVQKFFETFNCQVNWKSKVLHIENAPKDFEKFFGKRAPYDFKFNPEIKNGELITKESYLIKIINDYMEDKAETTILKIEFEYNPREEIPHKYPLRNCKISSLSKKEDLKFFIRFTFLTTIQYLNKKEQITTSMYLSNNEVKNLDESKFKIIDGQKRQANKIPNLTKQVESNYEVAKQKLKEILKPKIVKITNSLNEKLEEEITRIKSHSNQELLEIETEINKNTNKIKKLEEEYNKKSEEKILEKIKKFKEKIKEIRENTKLDKLKLEQEMFIQNEVRSHGVNIKNKIINTSIVLYPLFNSTIFLKTGKSGKVIEISYNPLTKEFSELICESCNKKIDEIIICSSGHLTCRECGKFCESCGGVICKKCKDVKCEECGRTICSKCHIRCLECGKNKCSSHFTQHPLKRICDKCLVNCAVCGQKSEKKFMKKARLGKFICQKCYTQNISNKILKDLREF